LAFSWIRLNIGFLLRENLLLYSSHLPLGVPNWTVKNHQHRATSGACRSMMPFLTLAKEIRVNLHFSQSFELATAMQQREYFQYKQRALFN
jgi:hypothetical protein